MKFEKNSYRFYLRNLFIYFILDQIQFLMAKVSGVLWGAGYWGDVPPWKTKGLVPPSGTCRGHPSSGKLKEIPHPGNLGKIRDNFWSIIFSIPSPPPPNLEFYKFMQSSLPGKF